MGPIRPTTLTMGPLSQYGSSAPVPDADIGSAETGQTVSVHLTGLEVGVTYHFRLIATNKYGQTTSLDQTFNFFPPELPQRNAPSRIGFEHAPDCRAYELVSPEDAAGTTIFPSNGPNSPSATDPSRLSFAGDFGTVPGTGNPDNTIGDLYARPGPTRVGYPHRPSRERSDLHGRSAQHFDRGRIRTPRRARQRPERSPTTIPR